jgi:hypothetical protein
MEEEGGSTRVSIQPLVSLVREELHEVVEHEAFLRILGVLGENVVSL